MYKPARDLALEEMLALLRESSYGPVSEEFIESVLGVAWDNRTESEPRSSAQKELLSLIEKMGWSLVGKSAE